MISLTKQQIEDRLNKLPIALREAIFSADNIDIITNLEIKHGLPPAKASLLEKIWGRVLMGFIPVANLRAELMATLELDQNTSSAITDELAKITTPLKSELDKFISPASTPPSSQSVPSTPNLEPSPASPPASNLSTGTPPAPTKTPSPTTIPTPTSTPTPLPVASIKPSPVKKDFMRPTSISLQPSSGQNILKPPIPATPFMLHQESNLKPIGRGAFSLGNNNTVSEFKTSSPSISRPAISARVEIGQTGRLIKKAKQNQVAKTVPTARRRVNYGNFVTPKDPFAFGHPSSTSALAPVPAPAPSPVPPPVSKFAPIEVLNSPATTQPKLSGNTVDLRQAKRRP